MIRRFLGALQFLTVLPVRAQTSTLSQSAIFFPVIGAVLGASAGEVVLLAQHVFSRQLASLLAVVWLILVTGALHEDGLADVADAFRAGRSREKIILILKDSRIGTYGAVALMLSVVLRWQAVADGTINAPYALAIAAALSRAAMVVLAGTTPAVGEGMGQIFASGLSRPILVITATEAVALSLLIGWRLSLLLSGATLFVGIVARRRFIRGIGGVNGDCLGATCQVVETINLLLLACRKSF